MNENFSESLLKDNFRRLLNVDVIEFRDGFARVEGVVSEEHLNFHGTAHGGYITALADVAFALAVNAGKYRRYALTVRMDFLRPAFKGDRLIAIAEVEHGRKVAFCRLEVKKGEELIARGLAIAYGERKNDS